MSFTSFSASTDGTTITIIYSYTGTLGAQIQAYTLINSSETAVGDPVMSPANISITKASLPTLFDQGTAYGLFLRDNELTPNQSSTQYYIYCKTNDASNIYLGTRSTAKQFITSDISVLDKSVILPQSSISIGNIYYFKITNSGRSLYIVPYITGISYPITSDQLLLTDDTFSAFDSTINSVQRYSITGTNRCYSIGNLAPSNWSILSSYTNSLTIEQDLITDFTSAFPINTTNQFHVYNFSNTADNILNLSTLQGNTFHYIVIYRSASGAATNLYLGFGNEIVVDEVNPGTGNLNFLTILLSQWSIFCLTIFVNSTNNKIYIVHTSTNSGIDRNVTYPATGKVIENSLINIGASDILQIPNVLQNPSYGSIRIIKYPAKSTQTFYIRSKASDQNSLFCQGRGFTNNLYTTSAVNSLCIWLFSGYDGSIPVGIILHQYND